MRLMCLQDVSPLANICFTAEIHEIFDSPEQFDIQGKRDCLVFNGKIKCIVTFMQDVICNNVN